MKTALYYQRLAHSLATDSENCVLCCPCAVQVSNFKQQVEKLKEGLTRAKLVGGSQQRVARKPVKADAVSFFCSPKQRQRMLRTLVRLGIFGELTRSSAALCALSISRSKRP